MESTTKPRYAFIDLAKGICIILVVILHICGGTGIPKLDVALSSFRMPLYFILSGIFFSRYSCFAEFIVKKVNRLLIPFLFFYFFTTIAINAQKLVLGGA